MYKLSGDMNKEINKISEEIISLRRCFHRNPELGFEEYRTSEKICSFLRENSIPYEKMSKTGVTAFLKGAGEITIGLRADMDALPVEEKTGLPFASGNKGIMHACGHDGHMAVVLGVAKVLKKYEKNLRFNVKFIFQPSEERPPGGAAMMIKEGVLDDLDYMLGFHFFPTLPLFKMWIGKGPVMANADFFSIRVTGRGGHGASPHLADDTIACSSYLVTCLQTIISRNLDPIKSGVLSVCGISGGTAYNVIPDEVLLKGTVRTLEDSVQENIKGLIKAKAEEVCRIFGCKSHFKYDKYVPSCINDNYFSGAVEKASLKILSPRNIADYHPIMGGEDFAFFSRKKPSCYIFAGIGNKFGDNHSSNFSIDERVLPYTAGFFASLITQLDICSGIDSKRRKKAKSPKK